MHEWRQRLEAYLGDGACNRSQTWRSSSSASKEPVGKKKIKNHFPRVVPDFPVPSHISGNAIQGPQRKCQRAMQWRASIDNASKTFTAAIKEGPDYVCTCCHRLMYWKTVVSSNPPRTASYLKTSHSSASVLAFTDCKSHNCSISQPFLHPPLHELRSHSTFPWWSLKSLALSELSAVHMIPREWQSVGYCLAIPSLGLCINW